MFIEISDDFHVKRNKKSYRQTCGPDITPLDLTFVGIEIQYVNRLLEGCKYDCQSMIVLDETEIVLNSSMAIINCTMSFS